mgnify:FL=1
MENTKNKIMYSFNKKASSYDQYSLIQKEVAHRLYDRLSSIKIKPMSVLDIGCGTGHLSDMLFRLYPDANIICLDISFNMLQESYKKNGNLSCILSDAENMPFKNNKFDLIISSFTLHWCDEIEKIFFDTHRFLKDKGLFLFSTVGPNTLDELETAYYQAIDTEKHVNYFSDMHTYGDLLLKFGFHDPVMDTEKIIVEYNTFKDVLDSLKKTGANMVRDSKPGYINKNSYQKLSNAYPTNQNNRYPVTYEMIYGTAWKNIENTAENTEVIPIKKI